MKKIATYVRFMIALLIAVPFQLVYSSNEFQEAPLGLGVGSGIVDNNFIGGFNNGSLNSTLKYKLVVPQSKTIVKNASQLLAALNSAGNGSVIYLDDNSTFDLTGQESIKLPAGVTLMSGRGVNNSKGALILTTTLKTWPLFVTAGDNIRIVGIRLKGPDGSYVNPDVQKKVSLLNVLTTKPAAISQMKTYGAPNSRGIAVQNNNVTIEDCEIYNWSHAGIGVLQGGNAVIKFSYIHNNQRYGLGYGVVLDRGYALIRANVFQENRHAVAGSGAAGSGYTAEYNVILPSLNDIGHQFDMHGGKDRKDGTNIAGERIRITNNLIFYDKNPGILIRGVPNQESAIQANMFVKTGRKNIVKFSNVTSSAGISRNDDTTSAYKQVNSQGNISYNENSFLKL